jgi:DNA-binding response OmpR family regulator
MKTILVLSSHPDFAEAIRTSLNPEQFRVVHRHTVEEGEPLLVHGLIAACVLDAELMGVECVWIIERLRRRDARTPIIAYTELPQSDWEEEAFLRGVTHILTKPVRPKLFNSILDRIWAQPVPAPQLPTPVPAGNTSVFTRANNDPSAAARFVNASQTLGVLRDFRRS